MSAKNKAEVIARLKQKRKELLTRMMVACKEEQKANPEYWKARDRLVCMIAEELEILPCCVKEEFLAPLEDAGIITYHINIFGTSKNLIFLDHKKLGLALQRCKSLKYQNFIGILCKFGVPKNPSSYTAKEILLNLSCALPKPIEPGWKERQAARKAARRAAGTAPAEDDYPALLDDLDDEIAELEKRAFEESYDAAEGKAGGEES